MTDTQPLEGLSPVQALNEKIQRHAGGNWIHNFQIDEDRRLVPGDNVSYRRKILDHVFSSLLVDRSVLVLDEASGVYPALVAQGGAATVAASNANAATRDLMQELWSFLGVEATAVDSRMVAFYDGAPFVDMQHGSAHEFLVVLNQVWPMFGAAKQDFDAVVEACAYLVTDGIIFDWTDAEWAKPPPPAHYNREAFANALRKKFAHVGFYNEWLIVATGKLPPGADGDGHASEVGDDR